VIQAYAERGEEPPTLRYFEDRRRPLYIPERDIVEQPWTEADAAADRRRHAEHVAALQRTRLFCFGVSAYIEGLSDNQVLAELTKLDSTWETKSIRYTKPEELRRELGDALYAAEAQEETA
jgi:hypothetical protein